MLFRRNDKIDVYHHEYVGGFREYSDKGAANASLGDIFITTPLGAVWCKPGREISFIKLNLKSMLLY